MSWMFDYIGDTIRNIAKVLFYICFVCGVIVLVIGLFRFMGGVNEHFTFSEALACTLEDAIRYESKYANAYYGKMQLKIGFYIVLSSFTMLPESSPNLCVNSSSNYISPSMLPLSSGDLIVWNLVCHSTLSYQKFCD